MKILVAEDEPISLELISSDIEDAGYNVIRCINGRDAIDALKKDNGIGMVITDWEMPEMSGIELCKAIRGQQLRRYVYLILLTSREGTTNIVEGLSAGADDFISKPFEREELLVRIRSGERVLSLESRNVAIFALAKLAESRDHELGSHLERVRDYTKLLTEYLAEVEKYNEQIDSVFIDLMYLTCPLHDIGKVAIPDHVLLKPARLDDNEFEIMKRHTTEGAKTLDSALEQYPAAKFLLIARDIALNHHEQFSGNGYPNGLKGVDIPLCARIFSIADVYDALTTNRVYKKKYTHDVARDIILKGAGTQFDPDIVDAFLALEDQFKEIALKHD